MRSIYIAALILAPGVLPADGIASQGPHSDAPEEIQQFGQLVGSWRCTGENLQQDGSWGKTPGVSTWDWYYVLDGYAVQDVWRPDTEVNSSASQGTNLRTFDPETGTWDVVWTTQTVPKIDRYRAGFRDGEIHIYAERPANSGLPQPPDAHHISRHLRRALRMALRVLGPDRRSELARGGAHLVRPGAGSG